MAKQNGVTAEEAGLYPRGGNLDIPKRGSYGKWAAGTAAGILFLGGLTAGYKALKSDYKTPDNSQKHAIVETEGVPEGFGKKPEIDIIDQRMSDKPVLPEPNVSIPDKIYFGKEKEVLDYTLKGYAIPGKDVKVVEIGKDSGGLFDVDSIIKQKDLEDFYIVVVGTRDTGTGKLHYRKNLIGLKKDSWRTYKSIEVEGPEWSHQGHS